MAQYSFGVYYGGTDEVPESGTFYAANNVSVTLSNVSSNISNWTLSLVLYNMDTGNGTSPHTVTSSNPSTVFTNMIGGNYKLFVRATTYEWVTGTANIN